jgi:hypothetical protein
MSEIKTAERRRPAEWEEGKRRERRNPKVGSFVKEFQLNLAIAKLTGD